MTGGELGQNLGCVDEVAAIMVPLGGTVWRDEADKVTFRLDLQPMLALPICKSEDRNKEKLGDRPWLTAGSH
ncbi:MAG: hypothetical protein JWR21_1031 [Herminiimonas sp.]|nr:hypothetical protein [Herminiimonas sp.]